VALVLLPVGGPAGLVADVLVIIGSLNVLLAGISIIPAFPLDGGRVVRALIWARTGNPRSGTRGAGAMGRYAGRVALVVGLAVIVTGDTVDGIMIGLVGWFLMASARSVDRWLVLDELVQGMSVGEAMEKQVETLSPQLTLDTFAAGVLNGTVMPALPVVHDDVVVGIVGAAQVRAVAPRNWASTRTEDVMVGGDRLPTATVEDRLTDALERLRTSRLDGMPVLDGTTLRGVLTRRSIAALLHARAEARGDAR
jgi:CBS domain-containing protein